MMDRKPPSTAVDSTSGRLHFAGREGLIDHLAQRGQSGTLLIVDLRRYSEYAIALTPHELNQLLDELWQALEAFSGSRGEVLRVDTSQFAIVWNKLLSKGQGVLACTRLLEQLRHQRFCRNAALQISPRIGVAAGELSDPAEARDWVIRAYLALSHTHDVYPRYAIYESEMRERLLERWSLSQSLARAVEQQDFQLFYQPRIELTNGVCTGVEALIRWEHEEIGMIRPDQFVPLLEQSGIITETTQWVIHRGARELSDWLGEDRQRSFGLNVSTKALIDEEFGDSLKHAIGLWTLDPGQLVLEVTETAAWSERERSIEVLNELRDLGIKVALDDFGTGYSTLDYLRQLPADELKIDRSFISKMLESSVDAFLVKTMIDMARHLDLTVIAEGAETREQLQQLKAMGCHETQGYAVALPMPRDRLLQWVREHPWFDLS